MGLLRSVFWGVYVDRSNWSESGSYSKSERDWFYCVPLVGFVYSNVYPKAIFFNIVDRSIFTKSVREDVVAFCLSSRISSPNCCSFDVI